MLDYAALVASVYAAAPPALTPAATSCNSAARTAEVQDVARPDGACAVARVR
jgi:hypothetical protein